MVSTFTPNIQLEEPARGDQVGTWDTPVNSNMTVVDKTIGAFTVVSLNNAPVVLNAAQFQSRTITFNSTLTGNVAITFPSSFIKDYLIFNNCTGSSAFVVTLTTTSAGSNTIGVPPGEAVNVFNYGTSGGPFFHNLARIGTYWDYGGSSVPAWVSACSNPPYLSCDGSVFSAVTYPQLAIILGGTTLPDTRGRSRFNLNAGTARVTAGISGVDGNTRFASGGNELSQQHNHGITDPGHGHPGSLGRLSGTATTGSNLGALFGGINTGVSDIQPLTIAAAVTGISINNFGSGLAQNMPPAYIGGITMIRAG